MPLPCPRTDARNAGGDGGMTYFDDVKAFYEMYRAPPVIARRLSPEEWQGRIRKILQELDELAEAQATGDLVAFADAVIDLTWVVIGAGVEAGLPFDALWGEVRRANMDKRGGGMDAAGKAIKPPGWRPPDIRRIIEGTPDVERPCRLECACGGPCMLPAGHSGNDVCEEHA